MNELELIAPMYQQANWCANLAKNLRKHFPGNAWNVTTKMDVPDSPYSGPSFSLADVPREITVERIKPAEGGAGGAYVKWCLDVPMDLYAEWEPPYLALLC